MGCGEGHASATRPNGFAHVAMFRAGLRALRRGVTSDCRCGPKGKAAGERDKGGRGERGQEVRCSDGDLKKAMKEK